jgi:hypothetical protein
MFLTPFPLLSAVLKIGEPVPQVFEKRKKKRKPLPPIVSDPLQKYNTSSIPGKNSQRKKGDEEVGIDGGSRGEEFEDVNEEQEEEKEMKTEKESKELTKKEKQKLKQEKKKKKREERTKLKLEKQRSQNQQPSKENDQQDEDEEQEQQGRGEEGED